MMDEKDLEKYGGLETLPGKEKAQFIIAFALVILAMIAFFVKIYFF